MFGKIILIAALALIAWAFVARASQGAGPTLRYTVKPGDTLWSIATSHYAGDPRDAIYRIDRSNHLRGSVIAPGRRSCFRKAASKGVRTRRCRCARPRKSDALGPTGRSSRPSRRTAPR